MFDLDFSLVVRAQTLSTIYRVQSGAAKIKLKNMQFQFQSKSSQ